MMKLNELLKDYGEYEIENLEGLKKYIKQPSAKNIWELEEWDKYLVLSNDGVIDSDIWENTSYEKCIRKQGNLFLTLEEAQEEKKRREVYTKVKKYAYDFTEKEWNNDQIRKWYPFYDFSEYEEYKIMIEYETETKLNTLYFRKREDIYKAIKEVGEDDFVRYYLGIKEEW